MALLLFPSTPPKPKSDTSAAPRRPVVELFSYHLDRTAAEMAELESFLTPDERERGKRDGSSHRNRSIAARALLRMLLSQKTGLPPEALVFEYGPNGKPFLRGKSPASPVYVHVSHSDSAALFAFSDTPDVDLEVEALNPQTDHEGLAMRVFSADELTDWRALPETHRLRAFFRRYVAKKSFGRAAGASAKTFKIGPLGHIEPLFPELSLVTSRWSVTPLNIGARHVGALTCAHSSPEIRVHGEIPIEL